MRHRGYKAYATVCTFDPNIARRACRLRGDVCELIRLGDNATDPVIATGSLFPVVIRGIAEWHLFDEGNIDIALHRIVRQRDHLVVVVAAHDHRIQSNTLEAGRLRCVYPGQYSLEFTDPGYPLETLGIQAVEADINPLDAGRLQGHGIFVQLRPVCSQQQFFETRQRTKLLD